MVSACPLASLVAGTGDPLRISDKTNVTVRDVRGIYLIRLVRAKQEETLAEPSINVVQCRPL